MPAGRLPIADMDIGIRAGPPYPASAGSAVLLSPSWVLRKQYPMSAAPPAGRLRQDARGSPGQPPFELVEEVADNPLGCDGHGAGSGVEGHEDVVAGFGAQRLTPPGRHAEAATTVDAWRMPVFVTRVGWRQLKPQASEGYVQVGAGLPGQMAGDLLAADATVVGEYGRCPLRPSWRNVAGRLPGESSNRLPRLVQRCYGYVWLAVCERQEGVKGVADGLR